MKTTIYSILFLLCIPIIAFSQPKQELKLARKGNKAMLDSNFVIAELLYRESIDVLDFDTNRFNLALALAAQKKHKDARIEWKSVEEISKNDIIKSYCQYNTGNSYLADENQMEKALEAYKQALRYYPKNEIARHNYWFLKMLMKQNPPPKEDEKKDNKDKENKDQENDKQKDKDDKNKSGDKDEKSDKEDSKDKSDKSDKDEDDKSEDKEDKEKDSEKENKDKDDNKSDKEEKDDVEGDNKDEEKKNEEEPDENKEENKPDNKDGEPKEEDQNKKENGSSEQVKEGELSKGDALRLLESIDREEDKTQEKIKAQLLKGKKQNNEKDW